MTRWYDVVVLGRSFGALAAAALLARRDFQVLVIGQGHRPSTYRFEGHVLKRRTFTLLTGFSPTWRRILAELAESPSFRRHAEPLDPLFTVLSAERRIELPPDVEQFSREIEREFPEVRQLVDELYATLAEVNGTADAVFERDAVWPPGSFWERIETSRAAGALPFTGDGSHDLLGKFPAGHPYRDLVTIPAGFATDLHAPGDQLPPFALARLHGAWTRGVLSLPRGEDEIEEFLVRRIEAHGGHCRLDQKVSSIVIRRGAVAGVLEDGEEEPLGTNTVLCDGTGEALADLTGGEGITKRARDDWPHVTASAGRFVVSMLVRSAGVPGPLPTESFLLPRPSTRPDPRRPVVHLQRLGPAAVDSTVNDDEARTLLVGEMLMPTRGPLTLLEAREALLGTVREHLPFLDEHLLVVDSPHDGLPLWEHVDGKRREIDRLHIDEGSARPEPMRWQWTIDPPGYLSLGGEPVRGPIPGTYLLGGTVLPALGQEGELLAAWGAARIVTRKDKGRQKMRRQMWSRIETT